MSPLAQRLRPLLTLLPASASRAYVDGDWAVVSEVGCTVHGGHSTAPQLSRALVPIFEGLGQTIETTLHRRPPATGSIIRRGVATCQ